MVLTTTPATTKIPAPMIIFRAFLLPFRLVSEANRTHHLRDQVLIFQFGRGHVSLLAVDLHHEADRSESFQ
jgi:hypothetical protein